MHTKKNIYTNVVSGYAAGKYSIWHFCNNDHWMLGAQMQHVLRCQAWIEWAVVIINVITGCYAQKCRIYANVVSGYDAGKCSIGHLMNNDHFMLWVRKYIDKVTNREQIPSAMCYVYLMQHHKCKVLILCHHWIFYTQMQHFIGHFWTMIKWQMHFC